MQFDAIDRARRPLHDLLVDSLLLQRLLHAPARADPPPRRAPVELECHARDDTPRRGSVAAVAQAAMSRGLLPISATDAGHKTDTSETTRACPRVTLRSSRHQCDRQRVVLFCS